ncbi:MAG: hypothetical protein M9947_13975 [Thermomicrobiales bacterium]|nr:hypothetical protein [Thermomicrobiales bacterium]
MAYARDTGYRAPSGRTIFDWLTGTGFLAVDAGAFFVALMVLLPWNLYRSPGDLWVAQPLRSWVFVLTFHALVVGAIALARGIVRSPDEEALVPSPALRVSSWSAPHPQTPQPGPQTVSAQLAQEWARRWLEEDNAEVANLMQESERMSARHAGITIEPDSIEVADWPEPRGARAGSIDAESILADWLDEQASEYIVPPEPADPLRTTVQVQTNEPETGDELDPEIEWKWVEAAASAWLSKREGVADHITDADTHA